MNKIHRQGDILIIKISEFPKNLVPLQKRNGSIILAEGEIVGHCHEIKDKTAKAFVVEGHESGDIYLDIFSKQTPVFHPDHNDPVNNKIPQLLTPNKYRVIRQKEYHRKQLVKVSD